MLCEKDEKLTCSQLFSAKIFCFSESGIRIGDKMTLRCVTQEIPVKVESISIRVDAETLEPIESDNKHVENLEVSEMVFSATKPVTISPFDELPALGKVVFYKQDSICAAGLVTSVACDKQNLE